MYVSVFPIAKGEFPIAMLVYWRVCHLLMESIPDSGFFLWLTFQFLVETPVHPPLGDGRIAMFSYFRTVYGSRWIGFDGFFFYIRKGGQKTWCFVFFWVVEIPFWVVKKTFWQYLFGVLFFVESWVLGSVEVCFFLGSSLM